MKKARNVNILSNCNETQRALSMIEETKHELIDLGYTREECEKILSQIALMSFQTQIDVSQCKASVVDFHNLKDTEAGINRKNITEDMIKNNMESLNGENIELANSTRMEVLIDGENTHEVRDYIKKGKALPAITYTVVSSILENAVNNSKENTQFTPLKIQEIASKGKNIIEQVEKGKNKDELIENLDSKLNYGGTIQKLSDREIAMLREKEELAEMYLKTLKSNRFLSKENEENNKKIEEMKSTAKECCSESTFLKIQEASGWQLNSEQMEMVKKPNDKEIIQSQEKIIKKQSEKISKLQQMLNRTLQFADNVRNSVFGKIFFGKKVKELPESIDIKNDEFEK